MGKPTGNPHFSRVRGQFAPIPHPPYRSRKPHKGGRNTMLNRRNFTLAAGAIGAAGLSGPAHAQNTIPFYASVGPNLNLYDLDASAATLTARSSVTLPANVQYAWPH